MNTIITPVTKSGNLILGAMPVERGQTVEVRQPAHHFLVFDKSGSMYSVLPKLVEDLKIQVRQLKKGDALTVGWFSSQKEFGFPIKGFRIVDETTFIELDRLFDQHKRAMSLTCFSDALGELAVILNDTSFLNARNFLTFFSDGWANSPSVRAEQATCREIMKNLNGKFDLVLTVPYSDYADRDFLTEMATLAGGECISSANLHQFTEALGRFFKRAEFSVPRVKVELGELKTDFVFSVDRNPETGGITLYEPDAENAVYFAPDSTDANFLYFLCRDRLNLRGFLDAHAYTMLDLPGVIEDIGAEAEDYYRTPIITAAFAAAVVLSQNSKQDEGLDVLGYLGDVRLVKTLGSAYTPTERANAEDEIRGAIFNDARRWEGGRQFDCTPDPDAFCLLDLLYLLQNDAAARFHPRHPDFKYKRIGRGGRQRDGYPMFIADAGAACPFSDLVWNNEFLNLSIRARISGTVGLPKRISVDADGKYAADGLTSLMRPSSLPEIFQTFQWRNYAIVKDGFLNVERLPVSLNSEPGTALRSEIAEIFDFKIQPDGKLLGVIALDKIPVINRRVAEHPPTAQSLAKRVYADEVIACELKTLKGLRDELDPKREIVSQTDFTVEEQRFLTALGFARDGSYSPPVDLEEATDHYDAVSFKIAVKGFSTLPKLSDVREKLKTGKSPNAPTLLMKDALENFNDQTTHFSVEEKLRWIDDAVDRLKKAQAANRIEIQKPKFAMVLGHKSFTDITLGEEPTEVTFDALGEAMTAKVSITKKQIKI